MAHKSKSIVFIDAGIETPAQLAAGVAVDAKVLILSPDEDGVEQITQAIATHSDISEIYIVAHGSPGEIRLGSAKLGLKTLPIYSDFLTQWVTTTSLKNLYLYGCNVAAGDAGAEFLAQLQSLTQTNIAASTQIIGAADQGGTWALDTAIGAVPPREFLTAGAIASYSGVLASDNDDIANAEVFTGESTLAGDNFGATSEPGEPLHDPTVSDLSLDAQRSANDSLWWTWEATGTGTVNVNTSGSSIDTVLAVYSGPPNATVNDLFLVARNDNAATGVTSSSITFNATANTVYYFAVDGVGTTQTDDGVNGISITLNTPPTITANQSFTVDENSAEDTAIGTVAANETGLTWSITGNNLDADGDGTSAFAIDSATGALSVNDPGDLNFEGPTRNFQLSIKAADAQGFSDTETVQVQVQDVDETPEIVSFSAPTSVNEGAAITLTGQIFDPDLNDAQTVRIAWGDGNESTIQSSSLVNQGGGNKTFSINHTYDDNLPNGGAYQVQVFLDEGGSQVEASAQRPVSVINVAPQILPDGPVTLNSDEDTPINFTLSASDVSSADTFTWSVIDAENGTVTPETATADSPTFTYTPDANFNGTDTFQVQVTDDDGGVDTVSVNVNVASVIDTPTAPTLSVSQSVINEGDTITLTGSFVDPDIDDTFQVSINWGDGSGTQTLVFNDTTQDLTFNAATNTYSFAVDHEYIADGDPTNISVIVQDSFGETSLNSTQITVNNEVPELLPGSTSLQIDEDTPGTITFTAEDTDDTFSWSIATPAANGTASVSTTDTGAIQDVTYTPNANYSGFDQFVVQVADPDGGINTANVTVFVEPVNDTPTNLTLNVPTTPVDEGTAVTLSGNFVDVDNSADELVDDIHTLTVDWGDGTVETFQESDLQADNTTPIFSGTDQPTVSFAGITHTYLDEGDGTYTVKVTATDAAGESVSTTQEIAVDNVDPEIVEPGTTTPIAGPIAASTSEDTPIELTAEAIDAGELDTLTWSIAAQPNNGSITLGPVTENGVQPFTYTPNLNYADVATPDSFTLRVTDGDGGVDDIVYQVTVNPENDAPEILINDFDITEGVPLEVDLSVLDAQDPDTTDNTSLVFTIAGAAADAFQVEGQADGTTFTRQDIIDGKVSFLYDQQVDPAFTITVTDAGGLTDQAAGNVEFVPVNDAPVLTLGTFTVTEGASALIDNNVISATDEETPNGELVFTVSRVEGGTFLVRNPETNAFEASATFTQAQINAGAVRFENDDTETDPSYLITVNDGEITTAPIAGSGTVDAINDPPTIDVVNFSVTEGSELPVDLTVLDASDTETVDNSQIIFTITGEDFDSFLINGQPPADTATEVSFTRLQIIDNEISFLYEGEDAPQFTITVSDNSDPALAETTVQNVVVEDFTPVNDLPVLTTSDNPTTPLAPGDSIFTVDEGGNVLLGTTNLFATDADIADDDQLLFEVSNVEGGDFLVSGVVDTSFTLGQLRNNLVRFGNDGTAVDPSFLITVSDGTDTTDPIALTGTLGTVINDAPIVTVNNFDFIENEPLLVDTTVLDASDEETTDDSLIQFTINNAPDASLFELKVAGTVIDPSVNPLTFNLAQVLNDQVFITYTGETTPGFQVEVNDNNSQLTNPAGDGADDITSVLANVEFTAQNDTPSFVGGLVDFTVLEGNRVTITTANIDATDADNADNPLRFNVSDVQGGNFVVAGDPDSTSFTRSQIIQGLVRFQHDGSETEPSYEITVTDGTATSVALVLSGDVTPVNDPPTIDVVNFSVTEGVELPIDLTVLDASDIETADNSLITFTITGEDFLSFQGPGVEYLDNTGAVITGTDLSAAVSATFNRQEIINNQVSFLYEGEDAPQFTITVSDNGSPTAQAAVQEVVVEDFTPVNDLPVLTTSTDPTTPLASGDSIFTVDENGNVLLSTTNLFATDADIADDDPLRFEVSNVEGGDFLVSGVVDTSFTLGQLRSNLVRFRNDGTAVDPSFLITVSDGTDTTDPIVLTGTLQNEVNDAPTVTVNNFDFIENEPLLVDTTVLDASDEETADDSLIEFTLLDAPDPSVFELEVEGTVVDPANGLTFNLAQVLNNQVFITYSGETAPSFQIEVNDNNSQLANPAGDGADDITPVLANVEFTPQNDPPSFDAVLTPFTVAEGSRVTITTNNVDATDADNSDNALIFEVSDVQGGNFVVAGDPDSTSFTRSQIIQGLVRFQHDGSGVDPSYQITVSDGAVTSAAIELTGSVNETNDAPTIDTNNFTLTEGVPLLVDTTVLNASDEETTDNSLVEFTILNAPDASLFELKVNGNVIDPANPDGLTFNLAQVLNEQVFLTYTGETPPSFQIQVNDNNSLLTNPAGDGLDDTASELADVNFTAINDAPEFAIAFPDPVAEGAELTVGTTVASDIVFTASDEETTDPANLVYTVVSDSTVSFQLEGVDTDTFTQAQLEAGLVTFVHDGSETPLTASVAVTLSDSDPAGAETQNVEVDLTIDPTNDEPQLLLNQLAVSEGATVTLDTADLNGADAETTSLNLQFNISNIQNGFFDVNGTQFGVNQTAATGNFTLAQVIQEQVTFTHIDDNEVPGNPDAQRPSYDVAVQDGGGLTTSEPAGAAADIAFAAVNDAPELEELTFTIAEDGVQLITSANVNAIDPDALPSDLQYTVSNVTGGFFARVANGETVRTDTFSQADINDPSNIVFVHDGSNTAPTYTLKVEDELGASDTANFTATLDPVNDAPTIVTNTITLIEGEEVTLTIDDLQASDEESGPNDLTFTITEASGGTFFVDGSPLDPETTSNTFKQQDVLNELVTFKHDDTNDAPSYTLTVTDGGIIVGGVAQDIETSAPSTVVPDFTAVNDPPFVDPDNPAPFTFQISQGGSAAIDENLFFVQDEESTNKELLVYTAEVENGTFLVNGTATDQFTQQDIEAGRVTFEHDGSELPPSYTLTISDSGVPTPETLVITRTLDGGLFENTNDAPEIVNNSLTLSEGETVTLTTTNLSASDLETDSAGLTFEITDIANGTFTVKDENGSVVDTFGEVTPDANETPDPANTTSGTFTLLDVIEGRVSFTHDGFNFAPIYNVQVTDAGVPQLDANGDPVLDGNGDPVLAEAPASSEVTPAAIAFSVENDVPTPISVDENGDPIVVSDFVISVPTITEGETVTLSSDPTSTTTIVINTDDEETAAADLTYTVDQVANGDFKLISTGGVITSFTQAQVDSGAIVFAHDDSELAPTFTLTLTDQAVGDDPANVLTQSVVPDFQLDNDAPTFTANQLAPIEGQLITLTAANIAASDREDADTQLQFSIDPATITDGDTTIDGNKFFLNGTELTATDTFTIVDINAGLLTFKDDGDEFAPTYEVTVTDTDGAAVTETATLDLTNFQVNDDPEITQNSFVFEEGDFFTLNKTDNLLTVDDETTDPALLTYTISDPVGVTFLRNGNEETLTFTQREINVGAIAFQHDDETTNPSFTITVEDPDGGITTAPAGISYSDVNDPPIAVDDAGEEFTTTQNTVLLTPSLVANDTDEEGATLFVASVNGGDSNLASGATVTVNGNAVSYNPNGAFTNLGAGETATDTFEYTVSDGGETATGTVTIVIEGVNDPPIAADDDFTSTPIAENTVGAFNVLSNDGPDPDGDTLTISSVDATGATGQVTTDGSTLTYDASTVQGLAAGETLEETFTYEISDGNGGTDTATVKVSVIGVDDAPVAVADSGEGFITPNDFEAFATAPLTDNDLEDDGDPLTITKLNDAAAATGDIITLDSGGTLLLNTDNSVTYTPPTAFKALAADETQDEVFTYTITDGTSESTATATITVTGVNTPPEAFDDLTPGFTTNEDKSVTLAVLANDTDADGDPLTISKVDLTGVQGKVTNNGTTLTYNPSPTFNSLKAGQTASETLTYTIADGNGGTDTASVSVTITGVNDAPNAVDDSGKGFTTDEDTAITLPNILGNDTDPDGDTLTISSINTSQTRGIITAEIGGINYDPGSAFNSLREGETAQDTFTYTVSDGNGGTDTATVTINITGLVEIPNSFFDYGRLLRYNDLNAAIPGDQVDSLPLAQLYDENFYLSQNRDVAVAIGAGRLESGYQHFVNFGIAEGRNPSILFDEEYYLANNQDVRDAITGGSFSSGLQHFLLFGHEEVTRNPSTFFNQQQYLTNNQDVATAINQGAFQSAFEHYIEAGSDDNRIPALALYNESYYLANNEDIRNSVINGSLSSGFEHFVTFGQREGRNPSSLYNEDSYLELNPDVANAVASGDLISGFQHYEQFGRFEGRPVF